MGSRFDELAKAIARGASRRTVLRGIVGGLLGAVAALLIPRGPSEAVEAGAQTGTDLSLRQGPRLNQRPPILNQTGPTGPGLNQRPPILNQSWHAGPGLNQGPVRLNQTSVQMNQLHFNHTGSEHVAMNAGRRGPRVNQHLGQGARMNQQHLYLNQNGHLSLNQRQAWLNQVRSRFNQTRPVINQHRFPGLNQLRPS